MANASVLTKYETALLLKGAPEFDRGKEPYQDVNLVIKLRNALVHYKPMWEPMDQTQGIEKLLKDKFPPNPLQESAETYLPNRCLGYGCAKWSVRSVLAFMHEFFKRFGLPRYLGDYDKDKALTLP
jgi:hypothetical protein